MKISKFTHFKNFLIESMSAKELNDFKSRLALKLDEIKKDILKNIEYDLKNNKIIFKNSFKNIDVNKLNAQIKDEFDEKTIQELNLEALFRKISQIIALKKRNTIKKIKEEFKDYIKSLDIRLEVDLTEDEDELFDKIEGEKSILPRKRYESEKYDLQIELLKLQEWVVKNNKRVAIVFEGRDAAGKGSTIKRFVEYMNPKNFRVVALGVPTDEEKNDWFGRYEKYLPKSGEIVFFDRSWHNRSIVEPALGYCTEEQYGDFMENVNDWENSLIKDKNIILIKLWFSITKEKQQLRFKLRQDSPLKYWKFSPNDAKVTNLWDIISNYKNQMFNKNSTKLAPWVIINSNDKKIGRLNAIRYVLSVIPYDNKEEKKCVWYPEVVTILK